MAEVVDVELDIALLQVMLLIEHPFGFSTFEELILVICSRQGR